MQGCLRSRYGTLGPSDNPWITLGITSVKLLIVSIYLQLRRFLRRYRLLCCSLALGLTRGLTRTMTLQREVCSYHYLSWCQLTRSSCMLKQEQVMIADAGDVSLWSLVVILHKLGKPWFDSIQFISVNFALRLFLSIPIGFSNCINLENSIVRTKLQNLTKTGRRPMTSFVLVSVKPHV